jgi:glycosyltransferase involved in cell wall biosynthesis
VKHILLLFHHYRSPKDVGGLRSWQIGTHLAKNGYKVTAVIPGVDPLTGKKAKDLRKRFFIEDFQEGVKIIRTNSTANKRDSKIKRALYFLSSSVTQFISTFSIKSVDIVVSTSIPLSSLIFSHIVARVRKIPHIIDVRDLSIDTAIELEYLSFNFFTQCMLKIERWLYKQADSLICISWGLAKVLKRKGIRTDKIVVIPIGYDRNMYESMASWNRDIKSEWGLSQKFVVLYAGSMGHVVDIPTLLDAAKKTSSITDIAYLFIGHGQNLSKYKEIAKSYRLNCFFGGPVPKLDIPVYCAQADVCVYPLKGGNLIGSFFGNKVFDYMGSGTPIIYSGPDGDIKELIERSQGGICVPTCDGEALAVAIVGLYRNQDQALLLGENARSYIEKNYTAARMIRDFHSTVSGFLHGR